MITLSTITLSELKKIGSITWSNDDHICELMWNSAAKVVMVFFNAKPMSSSKTIASPKKLALKFIDKYNLSIDQDEELFFEESYSDNSDDPVVAYVACANDTTYEIAKGDPREWYGTDTDYRGPFKQEYLLYIDNECSGSYGKFENAEAAANTHFLNHLD